MKSASICFLLFTVGCGVSTEAQSGVGGERGSGGAPTRGGATSTVVSNNSTGGTAAGGEACVHRGTYAEYCGTDGKDYPSDCMNAPIACQQRCPCPAASGGAGGNGGSVSPGTGGLGAVQSTGTAMGGETCVHRGTYAEYCGTDGKDYPSDCMNAPIACQHRCPCPAGSGGAGGAGGKSSSGVNGTGGSGVIQAGGTVAMGQPFTCGASDSCAVGQSYCNIVNANVGGATTIGSCRQLPVTCSGATDCNCLCGAPDGACSSVQATGCSCFSIRGEIYLNCRN